MFPPRDLAERFGRSPRAISDGIELRDVVSPSLRIELFWSEDTYLGRGDSYERSRLGEWLGALDFGQPTLQGVSFRKRGLK